MRSLVVSALVAVCLPALMIPAAAEPAPAPGVSDALRPTPGGMVVTDAGATYVAPRKGDGLPAWAPCTEDTRRSHPGCVTVFGRVVDRTGYPLAGFQVDAFIRQDGYASKPGWNVDDEDTFRPDFGDPMLLGQKYPEDVPMYTKFARDSAITRADGTFTIRGLYAGEVVFFEAWPAQDDPNVLGSYYHATPNYDDDYTFPTSYPTNETAVAYPADSATRDLVARSTNEWRIALFQSDPVSWTRTADPSGDHDLWTLQARYAVQYMSYRTLPADSDEGRYVISERVRDVNGHVIEPWTEIEQGHPSSRWGYGYRWFPLTRKGPSCGWLTPGSNTATPAIGARVEVGDIQVRWVTDVGTAELTIPVPASACQAYGSQPMPADATASLRGDARVGSTVRAVPAGWPSQSTFRYTWFVAKRELRWAVTPTLELTKAMAGKKVTVRVDVRATGYDQGVVSATSDPIRR